MMTGTVNADLEATLRLTVRGANGQARKLRAVIDTGFDGHRRAIAGSLDH